MAQLITEPIAFLAEASRQVQNLSQKKKEADTLHTEEKRLEKALEAERRAVAEAINSTVRERIEEISDSYDREISKGQDRLKKIRGKREKAKSQGVRERIEEETKELRDHNREQRLQMKTLFQKDRVPGFCKWPLFYALYMTRGVSEVLTLFLAVVLFFLAVPCGIYLILPDRAPWRLIVIYFLSILVFGGFYIFLGNVTKARHPESLKAGRSIRDVIKANNKKIKVLTNTIRRDRNEAVYNLEKYDDEITRIEQELTEIANKKKEALNTFDKVTKTIISDEIAGGSREKIELLQAEYEKTTEKIKKVEDLIQEISLAITDQFGPYISKEFMTSEKLDQLADSIRVGKAANLSEAQAMYRAGRDSL